MRPQRGVRDCKDRSHVILRSPSAALRVNSTQGRPRAVHDCYVYILANESQRLYIESENPGRVVLSTGWAEVLDSSLRSE